MSRIDELIAELCPEGVAFRTLGEVGEFIRGNGLQKSDLTDAGVGAIHYGQIHTHYGTWAKETKSFVSKALADKLRKAQPGNLVIATTSEDDEAVAKAVAWVGNGEIAVGGDAYIYRHHLEPKYAAYFFQSEQFQGQKKRHITGTKVRRVSGESLAKIRIPVPPLEVQREIVKVLDTFTKLEAKLEAELEARRRQYQYYRDALLTFEIPSSGGIPEGRGGLFAEKTPPRQAPPATPTQEGNGVRRMTLGDIGKVSICKRVFKNETTSDGDVPFYKIGTFGGAPDAFISHDLYEDYRSRYSFPKQGDILLSAAGTIGRAIPYDGADAYFQDSNIVWIDNDESLVTNKFLWHWYQTVEWTTDGGTIRRLYNENLHQTKIAIPSLEEQTRIVSILDKFDALVNDFSSGLPAEIKARRHQGRTADAGRNRPLREARRELRLRDHAFRFRLSAPHHALARAELPGQPVLSEPAQRRNCHCPRSRARAPRRTRYPGSRHPASLRRRLEELPQSLPRRRG